MCRNARAVWYGAMSHTALQLPLSCACPPNKCAHAFQPNACLPCLSSQAAVEEGIVPGGGTALVYASRTLESVKEKCENFDQKVRWLGLSFC